MTTDTHLHHGFYSGRRVGKGLDLHNVIPGQVLQAGCGCLQSGQGLIQITLSICCNLLGLQ